MDSTTPFRPVEPSSPVAASHREEVTRLLSAWRAGNTQALQKLTPLVYQELRQLAQRFMRRERNGHTLQATAVVHEAFVRMIDMHVDFQDRAHFLAIAATLMRRILVDHAKSRHRAKRGGGVDIRSIDDDSIQIASPDSSHGFDVVDIDAALTQLAAVDARLAQVIEFYYFGGLTVPEIASALSVSEATINRDLRLAKAWMMKQLRQPDDLPDVD